MEGVHSLIHDFLKGLFVDGDVVALFLDLVLKEGVVDCVPVEEVSVPPGTSLKS